MDIFNKHIAISMLSVILFCSLEAKATDDYLLLLEAEAEGSKLDYAGQKVGDNENNVRLNAVVKNKWQGECDFSSENLPRNLILDEFSSFLKKCSLATYVFYRRLDGNSQGLIYENYKTTPSMKLSFLRNEIFKYF